MAKMKTDGEGRIELRQTYWRCNDCRKIFVKAEVLHDCIVCPECGLSGITPITVFEVIKKGKTDD